MSPSERLQNLRSKSRKGNRSFCAASPRGVRFSRGRSACLPLRHLTSSCLVFLPAITHHGIRFPVGQSPRTGSQLNTKPTDCFRSMDFSIMKSSRRPNKSLQATPGSAPLVILSHRPGVPELGRQSDKHATAKREPCSGYLHTPTRPNFWLSNE